MGTTPNYGYTLQKRTGFADYNLITQHKRIRLRISLKHEIGFIFCEKSAQKVCSIVQYDRNSLEH